MERVEALEISELTPSERLALIERLWDSLDQEHVPLTSAQSEELHRRLATLEADEAGAISWEDLEVELERRCP